MASFLWIDLNQESEKSTQTYKEKQLLDSDLLATNKYNNAYFLYVSIMG